MARHRHCHLRLHICLSLSEIAPTSVAQIQACNYEPGASVDDGRAVNKMNVGSAEGQQLNAQGALTQKACNYDPDAIFEQPFLCSYPPLPSIDCDGNFIDVECDTPVLLEVSSGTYPSEVSWEIIDSNLEVVAQGGQYDAEVVCLDPEACYTINLYDSYGDGWNGAHHSFLETSSQLLSQPGHSTPTLSEIALRRPVMQNSLM